MFSAAIPGHVANRRQRVISEFFYVIELEKFVVPTFVTDRAGQTRADVRATRRAGAVIRIDHDVIRHLEIKIS